MSELDEETVLKKTTLVPVGVVSGILALLVGGTFWIAMLYSDVRANVREIKRQEKKVGALAEDIASIKDSVLTIATQLKIEAAIKEANGKNGHNQEEKEDGR